MRLIITRHGETIENKKRIMQGQSPGKLTKKGEKQAKKLAIRLTKEKINVVYCSDLRRCRQTLKPYLKLSKMEANYLKELREINWGVFNKKKRKEYEKYIKTDEYEKYLKRNNIKNSWYNRKVPGGESNKELYKRAVKCIDKIIKKNKGENVLIMTHGGTKKMILIYLLKKNIRHFRKLKVGNTALSVINVKANGNHRARLLNNLRHLD